MFTEREKAAIQWATHVTLNTAKQDNGAYEKLSQCFDQTEIIDLTLICSFFNFFNRVMDSLQVPGEEQSEINKIKTSVRLEPEKLKDYLNAMIKNWPEKFPEPSSD